LDAKKNNSPHAPFWLYASKGRGKHSDPTQSLRSALRDTEHLQRRADRMTMEHRLIWRNRLEWFCECLYGMEALVIPSLQFHALVLSKFMEVTRRSRDGNASQGAQSELIEFIYNKTQELYQRG
jgi:hypothetical protein